MMMRAVICKELAWPTHLSVARIAVPEPSPGQMLVRVAAAGLNFADTLVIGGSYQERLTPPFVPGAELSGTVEATGERVGNYRPGDRVMGQVASGAYAEYALLEADKAQRVPASMPFEQAGGFYIPYGTAYCGLFDRGRLKPGETVLITGAAGAVGHAAVELAAARDARVIALANGEERRAALRSKDNVEVLDSRPNEIRDRLRDLTNGKGVDVVLDVVGGEVARQALRALAFEGRLVIVGFASGDIPKFPANQLLVKNVDVSGFYWAPYQTRRPRQTDAMFQKLAQLYETGKIRPHVAARFSLDQINDALAELLARKHFGKLIVDPQS